MTTGKLEYKITIKWWAKPLLLIVVALRLNKIIGAGWSYNVAPAVKWEK